MTIEMTEDHEKFQCSECRTYYYIDQLGVVSKDSEKCCVDCTLGAFEYLKWVRSLYKHKLQHEWLNYNDWRIKFYGY